MEQGQINKMLDEKQASIRMQISLTPELKRILETEKYLTGESFSAYLRKGAVLRYLTEKEEKKKLQQLADKIGKLAKKNKRRKGKWSTRAKIEKWVRNIRNEWE